MTWEPTPEEIEQAKIEAARVYLTIQRNELHRLFQLWLLLLLHDWSLLLAVLNSRFRHSVAGHRTPDHGLPYRVIKVRKLVDS